MPLSAAQIRFYKTFGFLVRKNVFTPDEVRAYTAEIDRRADESHRLIPFDPGKIGQGGRQHSLLVSSTPFLTALMEDDRLAGAAEELCGEIAWIGAAAHQFVGDSVWHYDGGCPEAAGVNNLIYAQPVRADSGSLRVVPGSHLPHVFETVADFEPMGPLWTRAAATPEQKRRALAAIPSIPCFVCDADPGDDRRACTLSYHALPQSPEQIELAILNSQASMQSRDTATDPWNPPRDFTDEWLANPQNNRRRAFWIEQLRKYSQMELGQHGVRADVENGKSKMVPV